MGRLTEGARQFAEWMAAGTADERAQPAVAALLGVSQPTVSNWARGVSVPDYHWRVALGRLTGVPVDDWDRAEDRRALEAAIRRIDRALQTN